MKDSIIMVKNLTKTYRKRDQRTGMSEDFNAIKNISLEIFKDEILGIVGLSGSGKTTLLRCMLQLSKPTRGEVFFKGENIVKYDTEQLRKKVRPNLRKVYQHPEAALNPGLRVRQILEQPIKLYHPELKKAEINQRAMVLMQDVGLPEDYHTKYPHQLSGGEKRRVALARAISTRPDVLLADEPFAGLDKALQYKMLELLMRIKKKRSLTIVMVSHDIDVIRYVTDRIITLRHGEIANIAEAGPNGVAVDMSHFIMEQAAAER